MIPDYPVEDLNSFVKEYFTKQGCFIKKNVTHTGNRRRGQVKRGVADFHGHARTGVAVYCEVKTVNDRLSEEQIAFMNQADSCGCFCFVCFQKKGQPITILNWKEYKEKILNKTNNSK